MKPSAVGVATPKVGVRAAPVRDAIDEDVALPEMYPVRVVETVTVEEIPGARPVTVINPVLLILTLPLAESVPL